MLGVPLPYATAAAALLPPLRLPIQTGMIRLPPSSQPPMATPLLSASLDLSSQPSHTQVCARLPLPRRSQLRLRPRSRTCHVAVPLGAGLGGEPFRHVQHGQQCECDARHGAHGRRMQLRRRRPRLHLPRGKRRLPRLRDAAAGHRLLGRGRRGLCELIATDGLGLPWIAMEVTARRFSGRVDAASVRCPHLSSPSPLIVRSTDNFFRLPRLIGAASHPPSSSAGEHRDAERATQSLRAAHAHAIGPEPRRTRPQRRLRPLLDQHRAAQRRRARSCAGDA